MLLLIYTLLSSSILVTISSVAGIENELIWFSYHDTSFKSEVGYQAAIRFTPEELGSYDGFYLTAVKYYHVRELQPPNPDTGEILIYDEGTDHSPGTMITSESFSFTTAEWKTIDLVTPVEIDAAKDLWVSINWNHGGTKVDSGPTVPGKGGWIIAPEIGITEWTELSVYGLGNWFIQVGLKEPDNQPPVALAGGPYTGYTNEEILFDGSMSYDPEGSNLLYEWDFTGDGIFDWSSTENGQAPYTYTIAEEYCAILRVTDEKQASDTQSTTVIITEEELPPENSIASYVLFGIEKVEINKNTVVTSGDIGANGLGDGTIATVTLKKEVKLLDSVSTIKADYLKIRRDVEVWDLYYNTLEKHKKSIIQGVEYSPVDLPVVSPPLFPSFTHGDEDVTVEKNTISFLDEGDYQDIIVQQGGQLVFTGGVYNIQSLSVRKNSQIVFQGLTELRIELSVSIGWGCQVITDPTSGLDASDILFYVNGEDTVSDTAVTLGKDCIITGTVYAPQGTLYLKKNTIATGAFIGKNVVVGEGVVLSLESAFS